MTTVTRGKINTGDMAVYDGKNATASRVDATGGTVTGLAVGTVVDVLEVFGDGDTANQALGTIRKAVQYIGTTVVSLILRPGTWTIDADFTVPSNFVVIVERGCILDVSASKTLTFNCPVVCYSTSPTSGSGTVVGLGSHGVRGGFYITSDNETTYSATIVDYQYEHGDYRRFTTDSPDADGNVTFTVGSGGDFSSINAAMACIFKKPSNGTQIILQLVAGFTMAEQVIVMDGQNYGWMKIESVDATVTVDQSSIDVIKASDYNESPTGNLPARYPVFFAYNGSTLPVIGCLFSMDSSGTDVNYVGILPHGSFVTILDGCGVKNVKNTSAGSRGLNATHGSIVEGWGADFSGCDIGARVSNASIASLRSSDLSGSTTAGLDAGGGTVVNVQGADITGGTKQGIVAQNTAQVHADSVDLTGNGVGGTSADYSAIRTSGCAVVDASNATIDGVGRGVTADNSSVVDVEGASFDTAESYAIFADNGARVNAADSSIDTAANGIAVDAVYARDGSWINLDGASIVDTGNSGSAIVSDDSEVFAHDLTLSGNTLDYEIVNEGVIHADNETATGTYTLNGDIAVTIIDSSGGAVTGTLGAGPYRGFIKTIIMTDSSSSSTVSVSAHETSDPEVITFAAVDDTAVLMWTGTEWITIKLSGATV